MVGEPYGEVEISFQTLLADGERRLDAVDTALTELAPRYRGRSEARSYKQFIEALRLANNAARRRLVDIRDQPGDAKVRYDSLHSLLRPFPNTQEKLVRALQSDRDEALEVFAQPFTRLAKALLPNVEVLFFAWARDAFEIGIYNQNRARDLTPGAAVSLAREFGEDIQFLQLWHPALREATLFQHAVFGHELGHPAIRRAPPDRISDKLGSSGEATYASVALDAALRSEDGVSPDEKALPRLVKWFDELACDLIGMRLFGPVFAVAFAEVTSVNRHFKPLQPPKNVANYPPPQLRFEFLREELSRWDLGQRETELRPILNRFVSAPLDLTDPEAKIEGSTAVLRRAIELFSEHCVPDLLKGHVLDPTKLGNELMGIWKLLELEVPPAEEVVVAKKDLPDADNGLTTWSKEYDWRSILNGVQLWLLAEIEGVSGPERADKRKAATRIATGAIEMAEFQRRARLLRDEFSQMEWKG